MVLIKSATRGLCFLLGLLTGVPSHLAIPPAGMHELELQLRLTRWPRTSRPAVVARYGSQAS